MRVAVVKWPTIHGEYSMHIIAGNAKTDQQLSQMARRWAACGLSAVAYKNCEIYLITMELVGFTRIDVKNPE